MRDPEVAGSKRKRRKTPAPGIFIICFELMVAVVNLKKNEPWEGFPPRRGFGPSTFASLDSALPRQRSSQAELPRHDVHPRLTSIYHLCPVSLWTRPSSRLHWKGMETRNFAFSAASAWPENASAIERSVRKVFDR